jgi:hypothetical protein
MTQEPIESGVWDQADWRKSTRSNGGSQQDCVQEAFLGGVFGVRDSKLGNDSPVFKLATQDQVALLRHLGRAS